MAHCDRTQARQRAQQRAHRRKANSGRGSGCHRSNGHRSARRAFESGIAQEGPTASARRLRLAGAPPASRRAARRAASRQARPGRLPHVAGPRPAWTHQRQRRRARRRAHPVAVAAAMSAADSCAPAPGAALTAPPIQFHPMAATAAMRGQTGHQLPTPNRLVGRLSPRVARGVRFRVAGRRCCGSAARRCCSRVTNRSVSLQGTCRPVRSTSPTRCHVRQHSRNSWWAHKRSSTLGKFFASELAIGQRRNVFVECRLVHLFHLITIACRTGFPAAA